jgi:hypothetical protein
MSETPAADFLAQLDLPSFPIRNPARAINSAKKKLGKVEKQILIGWRVLVSGKCELKAS